MRRIHLDALEQRADLIEIDNARGIAVGVVDGVMCMAELPEVAPVTLAAGARRRWGPAMSAPQWKPGDVAMVRCSDGGWRQAAWRPSMYGVCEEPTWHFASGGYRIVSESDARPLVVIDPEDREQVERLRMACVESGVWRPEPSVGGAHGIVRRGQVQAALRSLVTPPKPDEPQGLGAVVEDTHGEQYVLTGVHDSDATWTCARTGNAFSWLAIPVARVLSEGWSE